ncbi:F-type H+-transporting ATPase subunit a [Butyrivibrio proteoclasticus]|uniref:ATP synthase subunit a n=1 Tax=Butyrivibrio proteoclasticus TaxID=43305 RepID=A0A1I5SEN3_9FIRM|nr:F0F1 ATP synthase subunit A [Butyrivibrio proteoclasticus]SFP69193.1 F-type H+-transporting ATPase subunit a [Butyrivibrio proteoclasticus]
MSNDFSVVGPKIYYTIHTGIPILGDFNITETLIVSWLVMIIITGLCIFLTRDLRIENISKRQAFAEMLVEMGNNFVRNNTGGNKFDKLIPFVSALFATSVISNLISLVGLRSPTADLSTEAGWAVVVFIMITATKIKTNGVGGYLKGFTTPIAVMTPFNILSELATPVSMACRHFGNILSGVVIDGLIYWALGLASAALFGLIPGVVGKFLSNIPILSVGIPAITGVYFDWFSGCMQAFIFCMLTVMYIANAAEEG